MYVVCNCNDVLIVQNWLYSSVRTNLYIIKIVQNETFNCKYNESEQGKILKTKTVCNKNFFFKVRTNGFFWFFVICSRVLKCRGRGLSRLWWRIFPRCAKPRNAAVRVLYRHVAGSQPWMNQYLLSLFLIIKMISSFQDIMIMKSN